MTEADWLAVANPSEMLDFIHSPSTRKIYLFCAACCRRFGEAVNAGQRQAIVSVEEFVDGCSKPDEPQPPQWPTRFPVDNLKHGWEIGDIVYNSIEFGRYGQPTYLRTVHQVISRAAFIGNTVPAELRLQSDFLLCIFGNPFRPVTLDPCWVTSTVATLARQMYDSRDFSAMPILADALQDAGCDSAEILDHCRDPKGIHVRGCFVVDKVLGKE